jgi:hypothetical protein
MLVPTHHHPVAKTGRITILEVTATLVVHARSTAVEGMCSTVTVTVRSIVTATSIV